MGVFPMAPVFGSDHSVNDRDEETNQLFRDYGPLFRLIRATQWGFDRSDVISIDPPPQKGGPVHMVFKSIAPRSAQSPWVVVLTSAANTVDSAIVTLKLPFNGEPAGCLVHLPGLGAERPLSVEQVHSELFDAREHEPVPLIRLQARIWRGAAVLTCSLE